MSKYIVLIQLRIKLSPRNQRGLAKGSIIETLLTYERGLTTTLLSWNLDKMKGRRQA
jgi:hypothetical protein